MEGRWLNDIYVINATFDGIGPAYWIALKCEKKILLYLVMALNKEGTRAGDTTISTFIFVTA